jgi:two-component system, NtrC family, sensor kinase
LKTLIAEDDKIARLILKKTLTTMNHEVVEAENGREAWTLFKEQEPDLVITDWIMPEMDGLKLCEKIRSSKKKNYTYIIILTVKDELSDIVNVFASGADDYVAKPFKPDVFKARIKTGIRILKLDCEQQKLQRTMTKKNIELDKALSNLKDTQSQMVQTEKMASIGQLAAGVAHEINNPIGFIKSNFTTLKNYLNNFTTLLEHYNSMANELKISDPEKLPDTLRASLKTIERYEKKIDINFLKKDITELIHDCAEGTERVEKIVSNLKNFAHPGSDKQKLMDVNEGIESTLNVVANEIKYKVELVKEFGNLPLIKCFPQQINQVFMNIFINAAQAIEKNGTIHIKTYQENQNIIVSIKDTGCGIKKENLSKIFDPFFTTKEVGVGTGLGMNIAYNIIKKHRGLISIKSKVGFGTTFTITLPAD